MGKIKSLFIPFTAEELADARELVESIVAGFAQETGVLTFEVERIAFDPMLTDWNIRSEMSGRANAWLGGERLLCQPDFLCRHVPRHL